MKKLIPSSSSADKVVSNIDLLTEILLRLPVRSLVRFKEVSTHWYSLITDTSFPPRFYKCNPKLLNPLPSGLFLPCIQRNLIHVEYEFVPLDVDNQVKNPPFRTLEFEEPVEPFMMKLGAYPFKSSVEIVQSSNGLLLCKCRWGPCDVRRSYTHDSYKSYKYCIYNPTTKKFAPIEFLKHSHQITLVFDPRKSPHYRIVCLVFQYSTCWLEVYSSETQTWEASSKNFPSQRFRSESGIYWNNALHWVDESVGFWYLKLDEESLHETQLPLLPDGVAVEARCSNHLVESCDHLVYVEAFYPHLEKFNVYEMKRDYSGWIAKYNVDLSKLGEWEPNFLYQFQIHALVLGQREEDSFLVFQIPGQFIRYNLVLKTYQKLCDLAQGDFTRSDWKNFALRTAMPGFLFMESLFHVSR